MAQNPTSDAPAGTQCVAFAARIQSACKGYLAPRPAALYSTNRKGRTDQTGSESQRISRPLPCDERLMRHSAINGLDCVLCDDEVVARQPAMTLATVSKSRGLFIIPPPPPAGCRLCVNSCLRISFRAGPVRMIKPWRQSGGALESVCDGHSSPPLSVVFQFYQVVAIGDLSSRHDRSGVLLASDCTTALVL